MDEPESLPHRGIRQRCRAVAGGHGGQRQAGSGAPSIEGSRTRIVASSSQRRCMATCSHAAIPSGASKPRSSSRSDTLRTAGASSRQTCGASIYPRVPCLRSELTTGKSTRFALRWSLGKLGGCHQRLDRAHGRGLPAVRDRVSGGSEMTFQLPDTIVLDRDLPDHGLCRGDLGAVVGSLRAGWTRGRVRHRVRQDGGSAHTERPRCPSRSRRRPGIGQTSPPLGVKPPRESSKVLLATVVLLLVSGRLAALNGFVKRRGDDQGGA